MARRCKLLKTDRLVGNRVSHANNKTRHVFKGNIQNKRIFIPELGRMVKVKLSTSALRTIDKLGLKAALKKYGMTMNEFAGQ